MANSFTNKTTQESLIPRYIYIIPLPVLGEVWNHRCWEGKVKYQCSLPNFKKCGRNHQETLQRAVAVKNDYNVQETMKSLAYEMGCFFIEAELDVRRYNIWRIRRCSLKQGWRCLNLNFKRKVQYEDICNWFSAQFHFKTILYMWIHQKL